MQPPASESWAEVQFQDLMKVSPIFSIVIPTFNRPRLLERAVASVKRQSFRDFELIVVDDCSKTNYSEEVCEMVGVECTVLRSEKNSRASGARNLGIRSAKGKYISFLDDDDEYEATFLEGTYETLRNTGSDVLMCWCSATCIDYFADRKPLRSERTFSTQYETDIELFEQLMSIGTGFGVTVKAECFRRIGLFDSSIKTVEDADFFLRVLSSGYMPAVVPGTQVILHNHMAERLTGPDNDDVRAKECHQLLSKYSDFLGHHPRLRAQLRSHLETLEK